MSTWPALAELTATAGADLVFDYLWEEVLYRLGPDRVELLARLSAVGAATTRSRRCSLARACGSM